MPQTHLLWHYRSRHESLIAFSNQQFYENRLYTFPSVHDRDSRVTLVHVDGTFDRGRTRQNRAEAEAVVADIVRRARDPERRNMSVGVVTFNVSQQNLIDDLLTEACAADPELEKWTAQGPEPLFIKNLENVQGDERDVILFSVAYGPDSTGKVYMNFGPLNRDGGWRRLNVAVSRARQEMKVFASLSPEQISLTQSSARGVAALRAFLAYARTGNMPLDEHAVRSVPAESGHVAQSICAALEERGFRTDRMVGRSAFRVDIGVVDPRNPERYLMGILLDGENYRQCRTTRDREISQIAVLEDLGWEIRRVWSIDWWDSRDVVIDRLTKDLLALQKKEPKLPPARRPQTAETPVQAPVRVANQVQMPRRTKVLDSVVPEYRAAQLDRETMDPETFWSAEAENELIRRIQSVLREEAPITESLLTRRVLQSLGFPRIGARMADRMQKLYEQMRLPSTKEETGIVYWKSRRELQAYDRFRINGSGENRREPKEIPDQEAANVVYLVLETQISLAQKDLIREAARQVGYQRVSSSVGELFQRAIRYAETRNRIRTDARGNWILSE